MTTASPALAAKDAALRARLRDAGRVLVAFSGGVDSSYLAYAAHAAIGRARSAVTAVSPSYPDSHRRVAEDVVARFGLAHRFVDTHEMESAAYRANNPDRCYHCKSGALRGARQGLRDELGFDAVAYGINTDDTGDFRPGHRAAAEHGVLSPFLDVALSKAEIRALSREAGLPTADLPASACLSSRLPYGTAVTPERLRQVEDGEERLRALGFRQVRLRHHGELARIEIDPSELARALDPADGARAGRRDQAARLPLRLARPRGLPHRRAERGARRVGRLRREPIAAVRATPLLRCAGAPRDLGLDQGRAARDAIRADARAHGFPAAATLLERVQALRRDAAPARSALARDLTRHFPHLAERAAGLAAGAGRGGVGAARSARARTRRRRGASTALRSGRRRRRARAAHRRTVAAHRLRRAQLRARRGLRQSRRSRDPAHVGSLAGVNEHGLAGVAMPLAAPAPDERCAAPGILLLDQCIERLDRVEKALEWCEHRPGGGRALLFFSDATGACAAIEIDGEKRHRRAATPARRCGPRRARRSARALARRSTGAGFEARAFALDAGA